MTATTTPATIRCPVCASDAVRRCGAPLYRQPTRVSGVPIDIADLRQAHYRCAQCRYQFVAPAIPEERLLACYRESSGKYWSTDPAKDPTIAIRRLYAQRRATLEQFSPGRRVLDFGCYDGGFLAYLGDGWEKFGIEPAETAAAQAAAQGVDILGPTVDTVGPEYDATFDAIILFDVMEHLVHPVETLIALRRLLRPGGIMMIQTGDSDAPEWRVMGRAYWYCGIVEHVGFFNRRSLAAAADRAALDIAHFERTRHALLSASALSIRTRAVPITAAYFALRLLRAMRVPLPAPLHAVATGPNPRGFGTADHFIAILRRGGADDARLTPPISAAPG